MLTIFAAPKAFQGHFATIQRTALASWAALEPAPQILLCGDEDGIAEAARAVGAEHLADIARSEFGTPLLDDLLARAEARAIHDVVCYANADIVLLADFAPAVDRVRRAHDRFLLVGQCWEVDSDAQRPALEPAGVRNEGHLRPKEYIDYFVFPRGLYGSIPPFALGRSAFDNWLLWRAKRLGAAVVDATPVVTAVHQKHDYSHVAGGKAWSYEGAEALRNWQLAGGKHHFHTLRDAGYLLTAGGLRRNAGSIARVSTRAHVTRRRLRRLAERGARAFAPAGGPTGAGGRRP